MAVRTDEPRTTKCRRVYPNIAPNVFMEQMGPSATPSAINTCLPHCVGGGCAAWGTGLAGAHGGADLSPAPRAPDQNLSPPPRAPVSPLVTAAPRSRSVP